MSMRLSFCVKAATSLDGDDLDTLTEGIEGYVKTGVDARQAEAMALDDLIAEVARERAAVVALAREQYPELFAGAPRAAEPAPAAAREPEPAPMKYREANAEAKRLAAETGTPHQAVNRERVDEDGYTVSEWFAEPTKAKPAGKPDPGRYSQPIKDRGASRDGQMEMAQRGSRIASLQALNDMVRQRDPDAAYTDDEIQGAANIDAMQDWLSERGRAPQAAEPATPAAALKGPRRDPATVNPLQSPYNNGDIVTIGGKDWMVKQDTPGWYLTSDGTWRGEHPTIKGIKGMVDLIREVDQAAQAATPAAAEPVKAKEGADDGTRFSRVSRKLERERDLIIQHNLTVENLLHAAKMGGIPVPSLAVTKADAPMVTFGEITLIGPQEMADPKGYAGTKVFGADIYSPRYPTVSFDFKPAQQKALERELADGMKATDSKYLDWSELAKGPRELSRVAAFAWTFAKSQGIEPQIVKDGDRVDRYPTLYAIENQLRAKDLIPAMEQAARDAFERIAPNERIFQGFTNMGNRRYTPHTLEKVVSILKKELRGGEGFNYGVGSLRAKFTPQFKSVAAIRSAKDRLVTRESFEAIKKEIDRDLMAISDSFGHRSLETTISMIEDSMKMSVDRAAKEYNKDAEVTPEQRQAVYEFMGRLRNLPTEYFEAKILRDVDVAEFKVAVVPDNLPEKARTYLESRGVKIVAYKKGDDADRASKIKEAADTHQAMFSRSATAGTPADITRVTNTAEAIASQWFNKPEIVVFGDMQDDAVPAAVRARDAQQRSQGASGDPRAFYAGGKVYLHAGMLRTPMDVAEALYHESLGHAGLRGHFGLALDKVLDQMAALYNPAAMHAKAIEYGQAVTDADGKFVRYVSEQARRTTAEEVLAELAQTKPESMFVKRAIAAIRDFLREFVPGFSDLKLTDADVIERFIVPARGFIERGQGAATGGAMFSRADQTNTPAFRKWFGASRVVDAEGKPLVAYHGSPSGDITSFSSTGRVNKGFYFSKQSGLAQQYANANYPGNMDKGGAVYPVFVSLQNPFVIERAKTSFLSELKSRILPGGAERRAAESDRLSASMYLSDKAISEYKAQGYDGIINEAWNEIVAFDPTQIKSATGNSGAFDGSDPDIRFSRAGAMTTAQDLVKASGGVFDFNKLGETKQDRIRSVIDKSRPFWLGALTRDQIADIYGKEIPQIKDYDTLTRAMENQRSGMAQKADDLYQEWSQLPSEVNDRLAKIMLDATVNQVHPDREDPPPKATAEQKQAHARVRAAYKLMPKDGRAMYAKVRDAHAATLAELKAALEGRIDRAMANGQEKAAMLADIRKRFDQYLTNGPYFPLTRFGDFLVVANRPDGERVVASYESAGEQQAAARALEADGFSVKLKTAKTYNRSQDGAAGKFIGEVLTTIEKIDMVEATINGSRTDLKNQLLDDINQLFIRALPDMSYRKHFAHRKNTPGFSADVMRGFASSAFHSASHIARLNHSDRMTFELEEAFKTIEQAPEGDFNQASQVLNEMASRHEAMLNPNSHPLSTLATQVGFTMYLGLSPAAGLINMMQVPMVTIPFLGARYGFGKATAAMSKAYTDIMGAKANRKSGFNAAQSPKLTPEERQAISTLQDEGVIDLTQAHDLAAATDRDIGNQARSRTSFAIARAMKIVGWTFHVPEVMNRQVTALMAYRLEIGRGGSVEAAMDAARESIKRTQFDYSSSNRARYMQGNIARVVTQFKQFSQNMTYFLGRAAFQAMKGEDPEVRRIARRQILATFAITGAMAGSLGMPGIGFFGGMLGMLAGAMSDDDEPWDWKAEYRNALADAFGTEVAEVFAKGVPRALMPAWDISGRVSLSDLWWRGNDREGQNPRESFASDMTNILGPTAGSILGWYTAADHMQRGNYAKAAEAIVPKFIRDPIKAGREAIEGVTSYTGEPLMETTGAENIGRILGFAPARVSEMYEGRNAVMNAKTAIEEKRQVLLSKIVKARMDGDAEAVADLKDDIAGFNERNPDFRITNMTITRSLMNRRRNRENTEDGILLPQSKESLRERGRFASIE